MKAIAKIFAPKVVRVKRPNITAISDVTKYNRELIHELKNNPDKHESCG